MGNPVGTIDLTERALMLAAAASDISPDERMNALVTAAAVSAFRIGLRPEEFVAHVVEGIRFAAGYEELRAAADRVRAGQAPDDAPVSR